MRTGGLLLIVVGGVLIYWVLRAGLRSETSTSSSSPGSSSSSPSGTTPSAANTAAGDIGVHSAIDTSGTETGTVGAVYTVNSTYGAASDQQKDDMNAFAHAIGG